VPSLDQALADLPRTDLGNAERLVARFGRDLRYCHPWRRWLVWDGRRWRLDDTGAARRLAKAAVRAILNEAATFDDDDDRKAHVAWARASEKRDRVTAMLHLAEAELGVPVLPADMDQDPWLFNCRNGTLDLRTGTLRPHDREDMITKLCDVDYDPDARCPLWESTLATFFRRDNPADQAALIDYWQRLAGYAQVGVVRDHVMPVAHGTGSNGKSTVLGGLLDAFGPDYAMKCPPDMLMAKRTDSHPTDRADLFGRRLVVAIETEAGRRLNETMVKELTGGDRIRARRMREDFWEFTPTHTLIMATNHKPVIWGTDEGIWRRLPLIPFTVTIDAARADKAMPEKLRAEAAGILAWCVRGCLAWQERGLDPPAEVVAATAGYRAEQDVIGQFLAAHCDRGPGLKVRAGELYRQYREWAEAGNEYVASQRAFGEAVRERGVETRTSNGTWYVGLGIKPPPGVEELVRLLEGRLQAGQDSVRDSIEAAGEEGLLARRPDGRWDAGPLWEAGRHLGVVCREASPFGGGKVWVRAGTDPAQGGGGGPDTDLPIPPDLGVINVWSE
jgi:putative DNA primase/helicase